MPAKRGPKPTPTHLRLTRGNPQNRPLPEGEPQPPPGVPDRPYWLTNPVACECWAEITATLCRMGLTTKADAQVLARYCVMFAHWRQAQEFIDKNGPVYTIKDSEGRAKYVQQWPQVNIATRLADQMLRIETEYGLTPSSRTQINVPKAIEPMSDLGRFVSQKPSTGSAG